MSCDLRHMTFDTLHTGGGEHCLKISGPYLLRFAIYDILKIWRKRIAQLIDYKGVYRTAPATPGLLTIIGFKLRIIQSAKQSSKQ